VTSRATARSTRRTSPGRLGADYWYRDGGKNANFDNPAFRESWEYKHSLIFDDRSQFPWKEALAQNLRLYPQGVFLQGQVAMLISASSFLRFVQDTKQYPHSFVTTFAFLPAPAGVEHPYNPGGLTNSGSLTNWVMMSPRTKAKDLAWSFMTFWLTTGAASMLRAGKIPSILEGQNLDEITAGILGPQREQLFDVDAFRKVVLAREERYFVDTITAGAAAIRSLVQAQTDRYLLGEISIDELVATIQSQANAAIQAEPS